MSELAALTARIDRLEHELSVQQDIHEIRRVQYTYGYFIDKSLYNEVVDLFSDSGDVWFLGGIYRGKAGVRRLYREWSALPVGGTLRLTWPLHASWLRLM